MSPSSLLAVGVAVWLGGIGCTRGADDADWFPLVEGMTWRYRTELPKRKQSVDSVYRVLGPRTLAEVGREGIAVEEHRSTTPTMWNGPNETELSVWVTDGEWRSRVYLQYDGTELVPQVGFQDRNVMPVRLRPGLTWESETIALGEAKGAGTAHRHRLEREPEEVAVPAGRFRDCLRLETESVLRASAAGREEIVYVYREWYAAGVGLVRMESWADRARTDERSTTVLVDWAVAPPAKTE